MTGEEFNLEQIPKKWQILPLSELVAVMKNGTTADQNSDGRGLPVTRIETISKGKIDYSRVRHIDASSRDLVSFLLEPNDLLFSHINSIAHIGKVARYDGCSVLYHGMNLMLLRLEKRLIDPLYGYYVVASPKAKQYFESRCKKAINQASLNRQDIGSLMVLLPPLPEQRKIAAILSSVDDTIEKTQAVIEKLQVVKKAMMQELLTRGIPGRHTRFKQTEIGEVPEGWEVTTVGALGKFSGGNGFRPTDWSSSGLPIIRIQNLNDSQEFNYYAGTPEADWIVEPGELLFAWAGSRGSSFGPCIWSGPRGVLNQHIHRITPHKRIDKTFLYYVLQMITSEVEKKAHGFKQSLVHLKKAELTEWPIAIPLLEEQRRIVEVLDACQACANAEMEKRDQLVKCKSSLMASLLTGELRVQPQA